jgi:hypothetical protein
MEPLNLEKKFVDIINRCRTVTEVSDSPTVEFRDNTETLFKYHPKTGYLWYSFDSVYKELGISNIAELNDFVVLMMDRYLGLKNLSVSPPYFEYFRDRIATERKAKKRETLKEELIRLNKFEFI